MNFRQAEFKVNILVLLDLQKEAGYSQKPLMSKSVTSWKRFRDSMTILAHSIMQPFHNTALYLVKTALLSLLSGETQGFFPPRTYRLSFDI